MSGRLRDRVYVAALVAFVCYLVAVVVVVWHGSVDFRDVNVGPPSEFWRHNGAYRDFIDGASTAMVLSLTFVAGVVALDADFWWVSLPLYLFGFMATYTALSYLPEVYYPGISFGAEFSFMGYSMGCEILLLVFLAIIRSGRSDASR